MYSWRHGDSLKGSPSQTTISHYVLFFGVLSDACSYIPICLRMVLVELMGFTKHGILSDKTGIVSEFRLAMGLLCWLQFSWMMYTPHPVSMAVMYLHLWHLSVDGKYFLVAKVQKPSLSTLDSIAWFKFVLHLSLPQVLFDLPLMWPWLLHTLVVSSIPCLSTSTSTLSSFMLTVCFCRFLARMLL